MANWESDWPEKREALHDLVDLIESGLRTVKTWQEPHIYIAGLCLARCGRLLAAALHLEAGGFQDSCGIVLRTMYENWIGGHYVLLGGEAAWRRFMGGTRHSMESIARNLNATWGFEWTDEAPEERRLPIQEMAQELGKLMDEDIPTGMYNNFYRLHSLMSAHVGLLPLGRYATESNGQFGLEVTPADADEGRIALETSGFMIRIYSGPSRFKASGGHCWGYVKLCVHRGRAMRASDEVTGATNEGLGLHSRPWRYADP